jgi:hypothetical protein
MSGDKGISADEVRAELEIVLASPTLARSLRLRRLLTYLCDKTLAGEADQIKEYALGVDVMDRPASFDPIEDAIARVEVHRLRKRLQDYYQREGAADKLRIVVPHGQYVPVFLPGGAELPPAGSGAAPMEQHRGGAPRPLLRSIWLVGAGIFALVIAAAAVLFFLRHRGVASSAAPQLELWEPSTPVRLACGQSQAHTDRLGRQWLADQYFEGGSAIERPAHFIARAFDPRLFDSARAGDFEYHIPLEPGTYELHLYFVETLYGPGTPGGGGEISRMFDVFANDRPILPAFDIISDVGDPFVADVRRFKDISPAADGRLHLRFHSRRDMARVSAIEIVSARPNLLNPVRLYFDDAPFTDSAGRVWMPAAYCSGGQLSRHAQPVSGTKDAELYSVERFGYFSFAVPVDTGTYALSLHFVEEFYGPGNPSGGGAGSRLFDVFCNGVALLRSFDIYKQAGMNHVFIKTFHGLTPNSQGKLRIEFVPVHDHASLYALEVVDESR